MSMLRALVRLVTGRMGEIDDSTELLAPGGVRTRPGNTGGGDALVRHVYLGPAGFLYCTDPSGTRIGGFGPDGSPPTNFVIFTGAAPTGSDPLQVAADGSNVHITALTSTTQATSDDSTKAATTAFVKAAISAAGGSRTWLLPIASGAISTKYGSSQKRIAGSRYFDPSDAQWGLGAGSIATLHMLLESTSGSVSVGGELFQQTGTGAPQVIAATSTTTGTTATHVTADVSSAFTNSSPAGIFVARFWTSTPNDVNQATCTGAWIEIKP